MIYVVMRILMFMSSIVRCVKTLLWNDIVSFLLHQTLKDDGLYTEIQIACMTDDFCREKLSMIDNDLYRYRLNRTDKGFKKTLK